MHVSEMYDALTEGVTQARSQPWRPWRRRIAIYLTRPAITLGAPPKDHTWTAIHCLPGPPPSYGYSIGQARQMAAVLRDAMGGYHHLLQGLADEKAAQATYLTKNT
ncbi:hypothetical protein AB0395_35050 [Streptosporangium sp. NPDC051023]|uniref:hypothetical protein n=1 Tax=Streptosporangium sp. NPDC051023 TaxID=3155410 RepID=UPI00344CED70